MFTIKNVSNLQWTDAEHTVFSCLVKYEEFNESHPTGANDSDPYPHIKELWSKGTAGTYGTIAEYVPPPIDTTKRQPTQKGADTL